MSNKVNIPYEAFLSENPDQRIFKDLRQFISNVYMKELNCFVGEARLNEFVQEVVARLYGGALEKFDPEAGHKFMNWLYTLVWRTIVSYHNRYEKKSEVVYAVSFLNRKVEGEEKISDDEYLARQNEAGRVADLEECLNRQQLWVAYKKYASTLTRHRQRIMGMYLRDIPNKEIARRLKMTQNAVNACICNTKKTLKKKMASLIAEQKMAA